MRTSHRFLLAATCALATNAAAASSIAVEYYHGGYGHYFVTASPGEIAELDAGAFPGWSRTGESFGVSELGAAGAANVCRFWSGQAFAPRSSHFYTPFGWECAIVKGNRDWVFEGEVFAMPPADTDGELRGGCGAALPPVQQRADGRSEPPLHDEPGDPVDDAGAGVDRRGHRSRRDRLRATAGPGGDHHGPGHRRDRREGAGVSRPQSQRSLRRERGAGLFGRRRSLSAHAAVELDGASRRRGDRRRLVPHVVSVANLRHRHHAVLDAGPAHWPEQLSSCRGPRPRAARRAAEIRRQADCATRGRVVATDGDERDRDGLEVAWPGVRSHGPGCARLGGRRVPGRADRHAAAAHHHQERCGDRLQGGLCRCDVLADQSGRVGSDCVAQREDPGARALDLGTTQEPVQGPVQQRRKLSPGSPTSWG